jgi:hypothetical protein
MYFVSDVESVGVFNAIWTDEEIKNEPMLFNCDLDGAYTLGGKITRDFIRNLLGTRYCDWIPNSEIIIDSRVHMLMPNWYPCIPGMHHDDVPRDTTGQPNYINPEYKATHFMGLVNGHIAPTQFALGGIELELPEQGKIIYKEWHPQVMQALEDGTMKSYSAESGQILKFDHTAFHQGTKAISSGWRWFIRASINSKRKPTNEVRKQVQVYLENPMEGW